jgi:putative hydrolase of the HAD superfamily
MRAPTAILFDLWGTLIDSARFDSLKGNEALLALAERPLGVTLSEVQALGERVSAAVNPREEQSAIEFTWQSLRRILSDSFGLRFRVSPAELEWEFWKAALDIRLTEGVGEALREVGGRGIRSAVISNSSFMGATIERELELLGILRHFEFVLSSADYGVRKPDTLIFEVALRRLGMDARDVWFAGDHVGYDMIGASVAGLHPVAYRAKEPIPPSVGEYSVISHWNELGSLLESAAMGSDARSAAAGA